MIKPIVFLLAIAVGLPNGNCQCFENSNGCTEVDIVRITTPRSGGTATLVDGRLITVRHL